MRFEIISLNLVPSMKFRWNPRKVKLLSLLLITIPLIDVSHKNTRYAGVL